MPGPSRPSRPSGASARSGPSAPSAPSGRPGPSAPSGPSGPSGPQALPARVVVYHAEGCHLCTRAIAVVEEARAGLGFELELVDIGGDPELERRYRELLPVVEIDGRRAFTFFVPPEAFRARFL